MIKAIIFDFDGLILETEGPCYQAWQEIYQSFGVELDRAFYITTIGSSLDHFDPYEHLEKMVGQLLDRDTIRLRRRTRHRELTDAQPLLPGVHAIIQKVESLGLKLAVASSSSREWVTGNLSRRGLLEKFSVVKCSNDVTSTKPSPELFLSALTDLGINSDEALVFEDSPNGVLAANRAGIFCVAVPGEMTRSLDFSLANMQLNSLSDLSLEQLLEEVAKTGHTNPITD